MLYSDTYNTTKNIYSYTYLHEWHTLFHNYNSMYNNKNTIKEKVIYMQAVAQQKYMWTETHCESLQHNNSEVV